MKLEVRDLVRQYPAVRALDGVSLVFEQGQSHAVVGENGAGKSTLMKILAGVEQPTSGEILIDGQSVHFSGVRQAGAQGIVMIHQELNLVDQLSAAENIFLGREATNGLFLNRPQMLAEANKWLAEVKAPFDGTTLVGDLSVAGKQLVEIAKAVSQNAKVLVLDEPTAVLSERETEAMFELLEKLKTQGVTLIYISHLLDEVLRLCETVSVLRDGKWITTRPTAGATPTDLASLMVGRDLGDIFPAKAQASSEEAAFTVSHLSVPGWVKDLSFSVKPGEVLGIAGLVGSGRTEACEALMGLRPFQGEAKIKGSTFKVKNPKQALGKGVAYLSEDRKGAGLVLGMSITDNATLSTLEKYGSFFVNPVKQKDAAQGWKAKLDIRANDLDAPVGSLSGGNQQKVALAKWLDAKPEVLFLDEPTRGVDVGAKREIYHQIAELAKEGLACVLISSEMPEIVGLCERVVVMREGRNVGELQGNEVTEHNIMLLAAGVGQ